MTKWPPEGIKPYYSDDYTVIYHGDCREILPKLPQVDLVLADPPYSEHTKKGAHSTIRQAKNTTYKQIPFSITEPELREIIELAAVNLSRWMVLFCDWRHCAAFGLDEPRGLRFVRFGVWNKLNGIPQFTGDRPAPGWEAIAFMHNPKEKLFWNGRGRRSVWDMPTEINNGHPTPKPLKLMSDMIGLFSDPGDLVLDFMCGSGTTLRAAKDLGRRAIGVEIEERYAEVAAKRIRQEVLKL